MQSGQSGQQMLGQLTGSGRAWRSRNYGDWTDRIAKGELPFAKPPRPQGVERNIVVTLRDWMNEKQYLHDLIAERPALPDRQRLRSAVRFARVQLGHAADSRSGEERRRRRSRRRCAIRACRSTSAPATPPRSTRCSPRPTGATSGSGKRASTTTTRCSAATGGCGWPPRCAAPRIRPSARRDRIIRRPRRSRWSAPFATSPCSIRRRRSTRFVDTCFSTHHLQFGYDANDTLWTSGGGPVVGWLNTKMFDETGDAAKSQGWTALVLDTNGNGKRDAYTEPDQPPDPTKDRRINAPFYAVMPNPVDGSVWGAVLGVPGRGRAARARHESAGDRARRDLQRADARLRRARRRHRQQGRRVGVARQRPHGQLRSPQVQGAAERAEGDRRSLSRRLVVPSVSRARASRASARTAPSRATTRGSISTTRSGSATTCRCRPAI